MSKTFFPLKKRVVHFKIKISP